MANISTNTRNINDSVQKMNTLIKQYNNILDDFYSDFSKGLKSAWSGNMAESYINNLAKDKEIFKAYGNYLKKFTGELEYISNNLQYIISKSERS